jgi:hypothetical protein
MSKKKVPVPTDYRQFKFRAKDYIHIENGWCVRELTKGGWRIFFGVLRPGTQYPGHVSTHDEQGEFFTFPEFADAVRWVEGRRSSLGA